MKDVILIRCITFSVLIFIVATINGCASSHLWHGGWAWISGSTTFQIEWEDATHFGDRPSLANRQMDAELLQEDRQMAEREEQDAKSDPENNTLKPGEQIVVEPRFSPIQRGGSEDHFPDGVLHVDLKGMQGADAARLVGEAVADKVVGGPPYSRITNIQLTRFGYYIHVDWGEGEDHFTGHVVELVVNLDKRMVWWWKCE